MRVFLAVVLAAYLTGCSTGNNLGIRSNSYLEPRWYFVDEEPDWDTPPMLLRGKAPIYPISRALSKVDGEAAIRFTIGTDGKARDFEVVSASDKRFADHSIIAMEDWVFLPAMKNGVPIAVRILEVNRFRVR